MGNVGDLRLLLDLWILEKYGEVISGGYRRHYGRNITSYPEAQVLLHSAPTMNDSLQSTSVNRRW